VAHSKGIVMPEKKYRPQAEWMPRASELEDLLKGHLADATRTSGPYNGLSTLSHAKPSEISFVVNAGSLNDVQTSRAGLLIVPGGDVFAKLGGRPRIRVKEVWSAVVVLMQHLYPEPVVPREIHATAIIGVGVRIGKNVSIGPYSVVGEGATIGDDTVIGSNCSIDGRSMIGNGCRLNSGVIFQGIVHMGDHCLIHPGVVLGADGFKFEVVEGAPLKIPQVGRIVIEDDVEIGANTTVDRAFLHETRIGRGSKIDNLVQIAHNVTIGPLCFIAAQTGIAGSTTIGPGCMIGGQCGFKDGIEIGPGMRIGGQAAVLKDFPEGDETIWGFPARPIKQFCRIQAALKRLPELDKRVRKLEKKSGGD
jgi:UDP-3-O-[3-hydroxymyristoyl] glucosamine N-acyltransferase